MGMKAQQGGGFPTIPQGTTPTGLQVGSDFGADPTGNTPFGTTPNTKESLAIIGTTPNTTQGQPTNINTLAYGGITGAGAGAVTEMGYTPEQIQAGQLATTNLNPYMNPYTQNVINTSIADINRQGLQMQNTLGSQANAARAFGGDRHGIAMGLLGEGLSRQVADTTTGLNMANWQQAQGAARLDIGNRLLSDQFNVTSGLAGSMNRLGAGNQLANISNLGFGMGQTLQENLHRQGIEQQMMEQALIDAAKQQYQDYTEQPYNRVVDTSLSITPKPQSTEITKQMGLFDWLTAASGLPKMEFGGGNMPTSGVSVNYAPRTGAGNQPASYNPPTLNLGSASYNPPPKTNYDQWNQDNAWF